VSGSETDNGGALRIAVFATVVVIALAACGDAGISRDATANDFVLARNSLPIGKYTGYLVPHDTRSLSITDYASVPALGRLDLHVNDVGDRNVPSSKPTCTTRNRALTLPDCTVRVQGTSVLSTNVNGTKVVVYSFVLDPGECDPAAPSMGGAHEGGFCNHAPVPMRKAWITAAVYVPGSSFTAEDGSPWDGVKAHVDSKETDDSQNNPAWFMSPCGHVFCYRSDPSRPWIYELAPSCQANTAEEARDIALSGQCDDADSATNSIAQQ
jgi:hypothetical protein